MTTDHDPGDADAPHPPRGVTMLQLLVHAAARLRDAHPEHQLGEVLTGPQRDAIVAVVPCLFALQNVRGARRADAADGLAFLLTQVP